MRTNIDLNDLLVREAFEYAGEITTKRELVETALREFVARRKQKDLRKLRGTIRFREDYNYRELRDNHGSR